MEATKREITWKLNVVFPIIAAGMNRNPLASFDIGLVLPDPFEESVSDSWLAGRRQVLHVLAHNSELIVKNDFALPLNLLQRIDTCQDTSGRCLGRTPTGHDGNIGVDDKRVQDWPPICRFTAARVIAAISPNSSPKKSLGQFSMSPNRFTSSVVSDDPSLVMSQK